MSIDKIRLPQGQSEVPWPQLPAKPAQETPLDQYVPATNWKGVLGVGSVVTARWWPPFDSQKISFRLLGQKYEWTIYPLTHQALNQTKKLVGIVYVEDSHPRKKPKFRFFDVTLADEKKEIFGYIAADGSVPFVCLTRHTPRAEKIEIVRIMESFISDPRKYQWKPCSECKYLDRVLRRLDDADMLNSFVEQLVSLFDKDEDRRAWVAERLIGAMESSVISNRKRVILARKILPMIGYDEWVSNGLAAAMRRGTSRGFLATMKRYLMPMLRRGDVERRLVAAYILLSMEQGKPAKTRFFPNISDILVAVRPVLARAAPSDALKILEAIHYNCGDFNFPLPALAKYVDLVAIFLTSPYENAISEAAEIIGDIVNNYEVSRRLLRRCFVLLRARLNKGLGLEDMSYVYSSLKRIGAHANADPALSRDVLRLLLRQVKKVALKDQPLILEHVAGLISSPHIGRKVIVDVLNRLEALADSSDADVAKNVACVFDSYLWEAKLKAKDLYRAAVILKKVGTKHSNDKSILGLVSLNYGYLAQNYNADAKTLDVCYSFLSPLAREPVRSSLEGPVVDYVFDGLGSVAGNKNARKEVVQGTLAILSGGLDHRRREVRSSAAKAYAKLQHNCYLSETQLLAISESLATRAVLEENEREVADYVEGLGGMAEHCNAGPRLLRNVLRRIAPYLEEPNRLANKRAFNVLYLMAQNNRLPAGMANPLARLLLVPLSDDSKEERNLAAHALEYLSKRFPNRIGVEVKRALRFHHTEGRFYREEKLDIVEIRRELGDAEPETRTAAAWKAKFVALTPEMLRSDIKRINSLTEFKALLESLRISSRDSDYYVKYESKVSMGVIAFVIEDKEMAEPENQPSIIVPDLSSDVPLAGPSSYKQKQHHIFRRFAIIPLNNTRRFSDEELKFIYEGLKALPYEVLGGFYSVMADEFNSDRDEKNARFAGERVEFKGGRVTIDTLYHEIGHSVFISVLTECQKERFIKLYKASKTDIDNYASGYATNDVDEDFAEAFTDWTMQSAEFLSRAIKQYRAGKPILLEKALLVAEVLSSGGNFVPAYKVRKSKINKWRLSITRYNDGKIKTIRMGGVKHVFEYDVRDRLQRVDGKRPW